eukprot:1685328-Pyramimonas_sp.AAC.1
MMRMFDDDEEDDAEDCDRDWDGGDDDGDDGGGGERMLMMMNMMMMTILMMILMLLLMLIMMVMVVVMVMVMIVTVVVMVMVMASWACTTEVLPDPVLRHGARGRRPARAHGRAEAPCTGPLLRLRAGGRWPALRVRAPPAGLRGGEDFRSARRPGEPSSPWRDSPRGSSQNAPPAEVQG